MTSPETESHLQWIDLFLFQVEEAFDSINLELQKTLPMQWISDSVFNNTERRRAIDSLFPVFTSEKGLSFRGSASQCP